MLNDPRSPALSPEKTADQAFPYRRVWRSVAIEIGFILFLVAFVWLGVLVGFLRDVPSQNWGLLLILSPLGVFLYVSVQGEQRAKIGREGLLTVTLFSMLLANGVGVPLVEDFFVPREWLSEAGFFSRVLGYTFTFGVICEFLKYIAIRYSVWPRRIKTRMDGLAYSLAAGMGYATVLNLRIIFLDQPTVTADAVRLATNFITQMGFGLVMGYFLAELALRPRRGPLFLAGGLFLGAFLQGLYIGFRRIAIGSGYLNGLILAVFFALLVMLALNFLIENAENREANLAGRKRVR
jgi:RsiW-degrading membrane proteinase PrsW (M82 family)